MDPVRSCGTLLYDHALGYAVGLGPQFQLSVRNRHFLDWNFHSIPLPRVLRLVRTQLAHNSVHHVDVHRIHDCCVLLLLRSDILAQLLHLQWHDCYFHGAELHFLDDLSLPQN
jgi:hypothetical protein